MPARSLMRKLVGFILRFAIIAACLIYVFWGLDWGLFGKALTRFGPVAVVGVFLATLTQYLPVSWRLSYLTKYEAGFLVSLKASAFCMGINNLLPAKAGEVAKAFYLRNRTGLPMARGLGLIFWERFFDLNSLLVLGVLTALFLGKNLVLVPMACVVGFIWLAIIAFRVFPSLPEKMSRLIPGERLRLLFTDIIKQLQEHMTPAFFLSMTLLTLVVWTVFFAAVALGIWWMAGLDLSVSQALAVFVVSTVGYAVPASPGGLGVYEAAFVAAMAWVGVGREQALALGLALHFMVLVPPILAALYVLAESGLSMKAIREKGEETL